MLQKIAEEAYINTLEKIAGQEEMGILPGMYAQAAGPGAGAGLGALTGGALGASAGAILGRIASIGMKKAHVPYAAAIGAGALGLAGMSAGGIYGEMKGTNALIEHRTGKTPKNTIGAYASYKGNTTGSTIGSGILGGLGGAAGAAGAAGLAGAGIMAALKHNDTKGATKVLKSIAEAYRARAGEKAGILENVFTLGQASKIRNAQATGAEFASEAANILAKKEIKDSALQGLAYGAGGGAAIGGGLGLAAGAIAGNNRGLNRTLREEAGK